MEEEAIHAAPPLEEENVVFTSELAMDATGWWSDQNIPWLLYSVGVAVALGILRHPFSKKKKPIVTNDERRHSRLLRQQFGTMDDHHDLHLQVDMKESTATSNEVTPRSDTPTNERGGGMEETTPAPKPRSAWQRVQAHRRRRCADAAERRQA